MKHVANCSRLCKGIVTVVSLLWLSLFLMPATGQSLFFSSSGSPGEVRQLSLSGADLGVFASGLNDPRGLAFDQTGNLYVATRLDNTIHKYDAFGGDLGVFASGGVNSPRGLAIDGSGNVYVANLGNDTIGRFDPAGNDLGAISSGGSRPTALAFDSTGNLYVACRLDNSIRKFAPDGTSLGAFATVPATTSSLMDLAFDAAGNLYVSQLNEGIVRRFDPSGTDLGSFASVQSPYGLAFDPSGNLYVSTFGAGFIEKFSSSGADLGVFADGLNTPTYMTIRDVPEPGAPVWGVVMGVSALLFRRLRRDRTNG